MAKRLNITVDEDAYYFVERKGGNNRSAFINQLIRDAQRRELAEQLAQQAAEEATDPESQAEFALWERMGVQDGLQDWEDDWDDAKAPRNLVD